MSSVTEPGKTSPTRDEQLTTVPEHNDTQREASPTENHAPGQIEEDWSPVKRGRSKAPSQTSSVHLRRSNYGSDQAIVVPQEHVLITQDPDDDDDDVDNVVVVDDEDELFAARTPSSEGRRGVILPGFGNEDDDGLSSGSDYGTSNNVDIDNADDYDTDLDIDGEEWLRGPTEFDPTGVKDYIRECNTCGVIPVSYFQRHIQDKVFVMRNHGLGPLGAKAIAKPLESNTHIEKLDLEGNDIGWEGASHIARMTRENLYITQLNLSENSVGSEGARCVCDTLLHNTTLTELDLSGNNLRDTDAEHFHNMLTHNSTLKTLHLKHNNFEIEGARWFRDALTQNETLKILDLSWNHIRMQGAQYLAELIMENYGLKYLNLAMNGLGPEGAKLIGHGLAHNQCLLELNLMANRITKEGAFPLSKGILENDVLETLRLGMNPIGTEGSLVVLAAVDKHENSAVNFLDLTNVIVSEEFEKIHEKMKSVDHRTLRIIHGGVLFKTKSLTLPDEDPEASFQRDPMTKLKRYAETHHLRLVDLFKQFDRDNSWSVDREEFVKGIRSTGIDMSEEEMDRLIDRLDQDGDGEIDYGELVLGDNEHRKERRKLDEMMIEKERKKEEDPYANMTEEEILVAKALVAT